MPMRKDLGIMTPEDLGVIGVEKRRIALARRQELAAQIDNPDHRRWMLGTLARAANNEADAQTFYTETHASRRPRSDRPGTLDVREETFDGDTAPEATPDTAPDLPTTRVERYGRFTLEIETRPL